MDINSGAENLVKVGLQPWIYENPQKYEAFEFEKIDGNDLRFWTREQLSSCLAICALYYIFVVWLGPIWMKNRKPFNLQFPLLIWNSVLAIFSIFATARLLPGLIDVLTAPDGLYRAHCFMDYLNYPESFWRFAFAVSKVFELGDTVFIVLRKRPLSFLHWFHHSTMVWITPYFYSTGEPFCRYATIVNLGVHSLMYSYFVIKTLKVRIPKSVSMALTGLQIFQFFVGLASTLYALIVANKEECFKTSTTSMQIGSFILISYIILFIKFFYDSYVGSGKSKPE